jgi:tetratricopeptide (TPR) repeat protein
MLLTLVGAWLFAFQAGHTEPPNPEPPPAIQQALARADALATKGQFEDALQVCDEAVAIARRDRSAIGEALAALRRGYVLEALERHAEAIAGWKEAAAQFARAGDGVGQVRALGESIALARRISKTEDDSAIGAMEAGLDELLRIAEAEKVRPIAMARSLNRIAGTCNSYNNVTCAHRCWRAAEAIWRRIDPQSDELADVLLSHGLLAKDRGDFESARRELGDALDIYDSHRKNASGASEDKNRGLYFSERTVLVQGELASLWFELGDLAKARTHVTAAEQVVKAIPPESPAHTWVLEKSAWVAKSEGRYNEAAALFRQVLDRTPPGSLATAGVLLASAELRRMTGDFETARNYLNDARAVVHDPRSGAGFGAMTELHIVDGLIAFDEGEYENAEAAFQSAISIMESHKLISPKKAAVLAFLAGVEVKTGRIDEGRRHYLEALRLKEETGIVGLELSSIYSGLCDAEHTARRLSDAERYCALLQQVFEEFAPDSLGMAQAWHSRAVLAVTRGKPQEAEALEKRAWTLARALVGTFVGDDTRYAAGRWIRAFGGNLIRLQTARGAHAEALLTIEQTKAHALEALLFEGRLLRTAVGEDQWAAHQAVLAQLHAAEAELGRAVRAQRTASRAMKELASSATAEARARLQEDLDRTTAARVEAHAAYTRAHNDSEAFWSRVRSKLPRTGASVPTVGQLRGALDPGTVAVTFMTDGRAIAAVAISADSPAVTTEWVLPPTENFADAAAIKRFTELADSVDRFEELVGSGDSGLEEVTALARTLHRQLFPGRIATLVRSARRLVISPDTVLWRVPFAALVEGGTEDAPQYLGERLAITYTPSLTMLQQSRESTRKATASRAPNVLAAGVSEFARRGATAPRPLAHAKAEATAIAKLYGVAPKLDADASETQIRQALPAADIVHFATHGRLNDGNPMSSAILLGGPAGSAASDDATLEAWEVFAQVRLRADLVVLSGCETARGRVSREGIVGLTRALQYAGAASVVGSQWSVDDASTTKLMERLHRELRGGKRKDDALRTAMAAVRGDALTRHPYYWAPFVLLGSPDNPWKGPVGRQ